MHPPKKDKSMMVMGKIVNSSLPTVQKISSHTLSPIMEAYCDPWNKVAAKYKLAV